MLQGHGTDREIISCRCQANADIFMRPNRSSKQRVEEEAGLFSSSDVNILNSDGEVECRVGCLLLSSSECDFVDLSESASDCEGSVSGLKFASSCSQAVLRDCGQTKKTGPFTCTCASNVEKKRKIAYGGSRTQQKSHRSQSHDLWREGDQQFVKVVQVYTCVRRHMLAPGNLVVEAIQGRAGGRV